jgi:DNA polymerase I-like protein with 3'-5' exonuclease and polymerase domains
VRTYLGRRARFGPYDRHYSALNRIIQGTEGDVNKRVLIEIHKMRHELGLTPLFTVHDEVDTELAGSSAGHALAEVRELLNTQYYDFKVPILWELGIGLWRPNWAKDTSA